MKYTISLPMVIQGSLPTQKYAEPPPLGYGGAPGNRHTKLKNSLVEDAMNVLVIIAGVFYR